MYQMKQQTQSLFTETESRRPRIKYIGATLVYSSNVEHKKQITAFRKTFKTEEAKRLKSLLLMREMAKDGRTVRIIEND